MGIRNTFSCLGGDTYFIANVLVLCNIILFVFITLRRIL